MNITAFSFGTSVVTGIISGIDIEVTIPYETDVTNLVANFIATGLRLRIVIRDIRY